MKLSSLTVDPDAIENGEWIKDIQGCDDLEILSKGITCVAFERLQTERLLKLPTEVKTPRVPPDIMKYLNLQCIAEVCILGWKNLEGDDGKPVPFSQAKALEIAGDKRYQPIHNAFTFAAGVVGDRRATAVKAVTKN